MTASSWAVGKSSYFCVDGSDGIERNETAVLGVELEHSSWFACLPVTSLTIDGVD
jgi:hypothetical protein